jgi:hypothetical protein
MAVSDRDQLRAMFDRAKIQFHEDATIPNEIRLGADEPGVEGYTGFLTILTFDDAGTLLKVGIWE